MYTIYPVSGRELALAYFLVSRIRAHEIAYAANIIRRSRPNFRSDGYIDVTADDVKNCALDILTGAMQSKNAKAFHSGYSRSGGFNQVFSCVASYYFVDSTAGEDELSGDYWTLDFTIQHHSAYIDEVLPCVFGRNSKTQPKFPKGEGQ